MKKGFSGPRSKAFKDQGGAIELPDLEPEIEPDPEPEPAPDAGGLVDYRTDYRGVIDQRQPRALKCRRCYGQGVIPAARHCGAGRPCPSCLGAGEIEPPKITTPEPPQGYGGTKAAQKHAELLSFDPDFRPRRVEETAQDLLPGDIDHPADQADDPAGRAPWD